MINIKRSWLKAGIICLTLAMVVGLMGVAYAKKTGSVQGASSIPADCGVFVWAVSNDDGSLTNVSTFNPVDPGDDGSDPSQGQDAGQTSTRYSGINCASASVTGAGTSTINVALHNAYPGYRATIFFGIQNHESNPEMIDKVEESVPRNFLDVDVKGVKNNQIVPAGTEVVGSVEIAIKDSALTNEEYSFWVHINMSQSAATDPLTIVTDWLPDGKELVSYSESLEASGGVPPYTWMATGLPDGLAISAGGTVYGMPTPSKNQTYHFVATVTDSAGTSATGTISIHIANNNGK